MATKRNTPNATRLIDLTGMNFGRWYVLGRSGYQRGKLKWFCHCECGTFEHVHGINLRNGLSTSCGCLAKELVSERKRTHGRSNQFGSDITYNSWLSMKQRCNYVSHHGYHKWGGRGIKVCKQWNKSFEAFLADMGERPSKLHSLDRIDNDGNYEPGNCRWATALEQGANNSQVRLVEYNGQKLSTGQIAAAAGMRHGTLYSRLKRGWSIERALSEPTERRRK